jgi:hypothetical protein
VERVRTSVVIKGRNEESDLHFTPLQLSGTAIPLKGHVQKKSEVK